MLLRVAAGLRGDAVDEAPLQDGAAQIKVSLGGRVAEEVVYAKITTGAESDLEHLTEIARQMIECWGMSEKLGPRTLISRDGAGPLLSGNGEASPQTLWLIDEAGGVAG